MLSRETSKSSLTYKTPPSLPFPENKTTKRPNLTEFNNPADGKHLTIGSVDKIIIIVSRKKYWQA